MKQDFHLKNGGRHGKIDNNIQLAFLGGMKVGLEALIHGLEVVAERIITGKYHLSLLKWFLLVR